jgi:dCTP deaminase
MMKAVKIGDGYELMPGACIIASTSEVIRCPNDIAARVEGKSSLGRLFLSVHVTAGWIDPGWVGQVTLEVVNHGAWSIMLWPGMKIAQVNFTRMSAPCAVPYGSPQLKSHYQGQMGPQPAVGRRSSEAEGRVQEGALEEVGGRVR